MDNLITQVIAWPTLLLCLLMFGFAPGAVLRMIVLAFRRDDPRRTELRAELPYVPRIERPFWVCEQLEVALFEGLVGRLATMIRRKRQLRDRSGQLPEDDFINVLTNYLTYEAWWKRRSAVASDGGSPAISPKLGRHPAKRKLQILYPTSVNLRAQLIVEDFRDEFSGRLDGRAKALVVTSSRIDALHMYRAIRKWDAQLPGCGFGALVAFSGSVTDDGRQFTESQLNGFPESRLPVEFGYTKADDPNASGSIRDEYRILIVVDKYLKGFDQPLLCGMYIDKPLAGFAAVQALSRLARIHPLKTQEDVRILDFVNKAEDIQTAFVMAALAR
jgi:hypothetical protein